jgi:hypothetical protein
MICLALFASALILPVLCSSFAADSSPSVHQHFKVHEVDGSHFLVKRLPSSLEHHNSCYEMDKDNTTVQFCYPSINVVGVAKCGTSALYMLFRNNPDVLVANSLKEYCRRPDQTLFKYYSGFPTLQQSASRKFIINGCIQFRDEKLIATQRLLNPNTSNIVIIRSLDDREWAAYNFWCNPVYDQHCDDGGRWSKPGMYRSPEMFDQFLRASSSPSSVKFLAQTCETMGRSYTSLYDRITEQLGEPPLMVAKEALGSRWLLPQVLRRMEEYIRAKLGAAPELRTEDVLAVNTGDHRGTFNVDNDTRHTEEGLYAISDHRPMLNSSREYIMRCWTECARVSKLAEYPYRCEDEKDV